jgi:HAE1 family hydrophobic/amphiphilic exporter-1
MQNAAFGIMGMAQNNPQLSRVFTPYRAGVRQYFVDIDREKILRLGIPLGSVFQTLSASMGSAYVNDFNAFGRTYQVNVQADSQFRSTVDDVLKLEVRAPGGGMVPMGSLARIEESFGPDRIERFNMYQSATVQGAPGPGISSNQAMDAAEGIFNQVKSNGMFLAWSGISYQERQTAGQSTIVFAASILVVYLILAAQYESWSLPLTVALSVPLAIIGAMAFLLMRGYDNNIFTQIGLVLLVGLAAKNAILIVEFARAAHDGGKSVRDAALEGAVTRFRPILMTSFAFILGCVPLMLASGAGANSRQALGTAVVGGMLGATFFGLIFTPVLYFVIQRLTDLIRHQTTNVTHHDAEQDAHAGA